MYSLQSYHQFRHPLGSWNINSSNKGDYYNIETLYTHNSACLILIMPDCSTSFLNWLLLCIFSTFYTCRKNNIMNSHVPSSSQQLSTIFPFLVSSILDYALSISWFGYCQCDPSFSKNSPWAFHQWFQQLLMIVA